MLIYVSGHYTTGDKDANIAAAREIAVALWQMGHAVICPHANTAHFEDFATITYDQFIAGDLMMIARCDALVMVPGWEDSKGARAEHFYALQQGIPIYVFPDVPQLHPTEVRCPRQVRAFAEVLGRMYRTHLEKNRAYSPMNILGTGPIGSVVRLWDKISRIMSLYGFRINCEFVEYAGEQPAAYETVDDTFLDAAVYSVIAWLLRQGKWGN